MNSKNFTKKNDSVTSIIFLINSPNNPMFNFTINILKRDLNNCKLYTLLLFLLLVLFAFLNLEPIFLSHYMNCIKTFLIIYTL